MSTSSLLNRRVAPIALPAESMILTCSAVIEDLLSVAIACQSRQYGSIPVSETPLASPRRRQLSSSTAASSACGTPRAVLALGAEDRVSPAAEAYLSASPALVSPFASVTTPFPDGNSLEPQELFERITAGLAPVKRNGAVPVPPPVHHAALSLVRPAALGLAPIRTRPASPAVGLPAAKPALEVSDLFDGRQRLIQAVLCLPACCVP